MKRKILGVAQNTIFPKSEAAFLKLEEMAYLSDVDIAQDEISYHMEHLGNLRLKLDCCRAKALFIRTILDRFSVEELAKADLEIESETLATSSSLPELSVLSQHLLETPEGEAAKEALKVLLETAPGKQLMELLAENPELAKELVLNELGF